MAESILAAALMFWFSRRMGFFQGSLFFFMCAGASLGGLATLFRGFRDLRIAKIVGDTPRTTIGSVAMGLVNIRGKAESDEPIPSPVSHTPCCFYIVKLYRWETHEDKDGNRTAGWSWVTGERQCTKFFLADNTGKAVIDLGVFRDEFAEHYQLEKHYQLDESSAWVVDPGPPNETPAGVTDEELRSYIRQLRQKIDTDALEVIDRPLHTQFAARRRAKPAEALSERYRLSEFLVLPGQEYQVIGSCLENTDAQGLEDRNLICRGKRMPFVISSAPKDIPPKDLIKGATGDIVAGAIVTVMGLGFLLFFIAWLLNDQVPLGGDAAAIAGSVWVVCTGAAFLLLALWMLAKPKST